MDLLPPQGRVKLGFFVFFPPFFQAKKELAVTATFKLICGTPRKDIADLTSNTTIYCYSEKQPTSNLLALVVGKHVNLVFRHPRNTVPNSESRFQNVKEISISLKPLAALAWKTLSSKEVTENLPEYFTYFDPSIIRIFNRGNGLGTTRPYIEQIVNPGLELLYGKAFDLEKRSEVLTENGFEIVAGNSIFKGSLDGKDKNFVNLTLPEKFSLEEFCSFCVNFLRSPILEEYNLVVEGLKTPKERPSTHSRVPEHIHRGVEVYVSKVRNLGFV